MNNWNFTGRLAKDAESKFLPNGDAIVNFSCAVDSGYGDKKKTTWPNCAMFGKRGEAVAPYLLKGTQVAISGELTNREYTDKDGNKRYSLDVRVNDLTLIGGKKDNEPQREAQPARKQASNQTDSFADMSDDIPFMNCLRGVRAYLV